MPVISLLFVVLCTTLWVGCGDDGTSPPPPPPPTTFAARAGGNTDDVGNGVATDAAGNTIATGMFTGSALFGNTQIVSAGGQDIFVVKYGPSGGFLWVVRAGDVGDDSGYGIATDGSGNIAVAGSFVGNMIIGGVPLTSAGGTDIFVAVYDPTGSLLWANSAGGPNDDMAAAVATDGSGNVVVTGDYQDTATFDGLQITSAGAADIFFAKYNPTGALVWVTSAGGVGVDEGWGIAVDGANNVIGTGGYSGAATFAPLPPINSMAGMDAFIAKYNPAGAAVWVKSGASLGTVTGLGVATHGAAGNIVVTGLFIGAASFDGNQITNAGNSDIFLVKYDGTGAFQYLLGIGGLGNDEGSGVTIGGSGNAIVTGVFTGTVDFGSGPVTSAGSDDVFVAKYDPNGAAIWSQQAGGTGSDGGKGVAVTGSGDIATTGYFSGTGTFAGKQLTSIGQLDVFIMKTNANGQI
jgi:hypothetical protein